MHGIRFSIREINLLKKVLALFHHRSVNDNERGNGRKSFRLEIVLSRCRRRKKKFNLSDLVE